MPLGWTLASATCTGDDDGTNPASIVLDAGETITCTFTNTLVVQVFGKTMGFWGNKNGNARLDPGGDGTIDIPSNLGGGSRFVLVDTILENNKIEPSQLNACGLGAPIIFGTLTTDCTLSINRGTLNTLAGQTLALDHNISLISGYLGQTVAGLSCTAFLTSPLTALGLSSTSTVSNVLAVANTLIGNSALGGSTTQPQAGAMNSLLGCLNREQ